MVTDGLALARDQARAAPRSHQHLALVALAIPAAEGGADAPAERAMPCTYAHMLACMHAWRVRAHACPHMHVCVCMVSKATTYLRRHLVVGSMAHLASRKSSGISSFLLLSSDSMGGPWGCAHAHTHATGHSIDGLNPALTRQQGLDIGGVVSGQDAAHARGRVTEEAASAPCTHAAGPRYQRTHNTGGKCATHTQAEGHKHTQAAPCRPPSARVLTHASVVHLDTCIEIHAQGPPASRHMHKPPHPPRPLPPSKHGHAPHTCSRPCTQRFYWRTRACTHPRAHTKARAVSPIIYAHTSMSKQARPHKHAQPPTIYAHTGTPTQARAAS